MAKLLNPLTRLEGGQRRASDPREHAGLSASAGTGKTHVLSARVLRLLLAGVDPSTILCLTFTKAAAAEMSERIHERLAYWVRLEDRNLRKELFALDEPTDDVMLQRARTLFARVLDAPGGGMRIQTIHAFAQSLLASFPAEADLTPGFRPLETREEQLLARRTLADLLLAAEREGDLGLIDDLHSLSLRLGEGGAEAFLRQCARAPSAMEGLGPRQSIEARLRRAFDLPSGNIEEAIAGQCADTVFDIEAVRHVLRLNRDWGRQQGDSRASLCNQWLQASPAERAELLEGLHGVWAKKDGEIRSFGRGQAPAVEDYLHFATRAFECCGRLLAMRKRAALVRDLSAGLRAGQSFASAYATAKRLTGTVDFDDLIRWAEQLLLSEGIGDWIRYKLDQGLDHILVDEAQDTNERQWNIVRALTLEYFAGEGASNRHRTIFTVGDFKQAIYGFQGSDPKSFDLARAWFKREAEGVEREFLELSMDLSFRTSPPVLAVVDRLLADLGDEALGLLQPPNPHQSHHSGRPGSVTLWEPFTTESLRDEEAGEEGWISDTVRAYATQLANQIRDWLANPFEVAGTAGKRRPIRPEDVLILVRKRGDLASLIVARLHAVGVPVAGVDRLLLSAPLAVQDLLAAIRFAVQPFDDLNLAGLLVSPIVGWTQEDLFQVAEGRAGTLWAEVRRRRDEIRSCAVAVEALSQMLAMADYAGPHAFLEAILSGPLNGRRRLLERLGPEARDPIEELLSGALDFESRSPPSLQQFLDWFARGEVEIVRDPSAPRDAVRVMTVHGAKGLQAPVVILADACGDPDRRGGIELASATFSDDLAGIPIFRPRRDEMPAMLQEQFDAQAQLDRQEHWRLLYVAMTRAEERLVVAGSLAEDREEAPMASWHRAFQQSMSELGCEWEEDRRWGRTLHFGDPLKGAAPEPVRSKSEEPVLPQWLSAQAPPESRPPRPLAPSSLGEDQVAEPPASAAMLAAAERGKLLHQLFERLPEIDPAERRERGDRWLLNAAGVRSAEARAELVAEACAIISDPLLAPVFGAGALVEAPIAAVLPGGDVIAGTVDRLFVSETSVRLIDFKTGKRVPDAEETIPLPHLRQMAAYVAALEVIFPGREVEAFLLYTSGPRLFGLDRGRLKLHLPQSVLLTS